MRYISKNGYVSNLWMYFYCRKKTRIKTAKSLRKRAWIQSHSRRYCCTVELGTNHFTAAGVAQSANCPQRKNVSHKTIPFPLGLTPVINLKKTPVMNSSGRKTSFNVMTKNIKTKNLKWLRNVVDPPLQCMGV